MKCIKNNINGNAKKACYDKRRKTFEKGKNKKAV
jgi:hypothetical protein